ncbi:unnamed protein product [Adineta steineri]|uniref:Glycolipid transfer protein domain-containing protein n=2 Tax=Adineta steineri TaxID=433720 RepID=A0A813MG32_9BILA|nr:unnamed protein product [Adineta steineri]
MSSIPITQLATDMTISSKQKINSSEIPIQDCTSQFDLKKLRDAFVNCVQSDHTLLLQEYIRAYEELCLFVSSLGTIFEWITKDLSNKLLVLKEHQRLDPINYKSIQSMISYEIASGRIQTKDTSLFIQPGKPLQNGCRTLLRLHRALAFISCFLSEMRNASDDASSASIACNAYSHTLGRFHSWPVRYTIHTAIKLTVPNRQDLIKKFVNNRSAEEIDVFSGEIVQSCNTIEHTTQKLFRSYHLTKLP